MMEKEPIPDVEIADGQSNGICNKDQSPEKEDAGDTNSLDRINDTGTPEMVIVDDSELRCGWGPFTPEWLQCCHTSVCLLIVLSTMGFIQGMVVNGFVSTSISNLEKRFDLQSTQTGVVAASYDIGYLLVVILVSYYGGQGHKGRWLGWGTVLMAVGSIVFALPQFTTGPYTVGQKEENTCHLDSASETCSGDGLSNYVGVFIFGNILHGIGAAPMYTLGYTYLDENVSPHNSAIVLGIFYSVAIVGPALGYLIAGFFLSIYGDIGFVDLDTVTITNDDPRWYGAWWIGFVLAAVLAFIIAIPILAFARQLPGSAEKQALKAKESCGGEEVVAQPGFGTTLKDLPKALKLLFLNKTFMLLTLTGTCDNFLMNSFVTFFPKYMEHQFGLTASEASFYSGLCVVLGVLAGCITSSAAISKLQMNCKSILRLGTIGIFISVLGFGTFLFSCSPPPYVGISAEYYTHESQESVNLTAACNSNCNCDISSYEPVCHTSDVLYFSPCHAGCLNSSNDQFFNCSCLPDNATMSLAGSDTCHNPCTVFYGFLAFLFFLIASTFIAVIPVVQGVLRCVPFSQRSLAIGLGWVFGRLLGSIPGPIVYGIIIDAACSLWGEKCGKRTSCLAYDNVAMRRNFAITGLVLRLLTCVFLLLSWITYKPKEEKDDKGDLYKETDGQGEREMQNKVTQM